MAQRRWLVERRPLRNPPPPPTVTSPQTHAMTHELGSQPVTPFSGGRGTLEQRQQQMAPPDRDWTAVQEGREAGTARAKWRPTRPVAALRCPLPPPPRHPVPHSCTPRRYCRGAAPILRAPSVPPLHPNGPKWRIHGPWPSCLWGMGPTRCVRTHGPGSLGSLCPPHNTAQTVARGGRSRRWHGTGFAGGGGGRGHQCPASPNGHWRWDQNSVSGPPPPLLTGEKSPREGQRMAIGQSAPPVADQNKPKATCLTPPPLGYQPGAQILGRADCPFCHPDWPTGDR